MAVITLKGDEVYSAITVGDQKMPYKGTRAGQFYFLMTVGDRNGTCSEQFAADFKAGKVDSVSYSETTYQPMAADGKTKRVDPVTGAEMPERKSLSFGGYETFAQKIARLSGKKDLIKAEAQLAATAKVAGKVAEIEAYKEANIDETLMKELLAIA